MLFSWIIDYTCYKSIYNQGDKIMKIKSLFIKKLYVIHLSWDNNEIGLTIETYKLPYRSTWIMISRYWQGITIEKFGHKLNQLLCINIGYFQFHFNLPAWIVKLSYKEIIR